MQKGAPMAPEDTSNLPDPGSFMVGGTYEVPPDMLGREPTMFGPGDRTLPVIYNNTGGALKILGPEDWKAKRADDRRRAETWRRECIRRDFAREFPEAYAALQELGLEPTVQAEN